MNTISPRSLLTIGSASSMATQVSPKPSKKIHILHVVRLLDVGGLERVVLDLVRKIDKTRYQVSVVCLQELGSLAPLFIQEGIPVETLHCKGSGLMRTAYRLSRYLGKVRPDIVHTHNPAPHVAGSLAATLAGLPVVINTKHGRNKPERRDAVFYNRIATLLSNTIIGVSKDASKVAIDIERVPRRKVQLIHNGIDLDRFPFTERQPKSACLNAVHVARLNPVKDQKTLLEAVHWVVDREPQFRIRIVGDGPLREELFHHRNSLGLEKEVEFLGERSDVPQLLSQADFFILSSLKEGLSLTLLEAMANGLAIVATDVGGNREVVTPHKTGLLVPSRTPEKLGKAILELVRNPSLTLEMGREGRRVVEKQFSLAAMVGAYTRIYEELINQKIKR